MVKLSVKWNRQVFEDIEVNPSLPTIVFKAQLCSLTGVPPERQKLMGLKGGPLKDESDLNNVGLKDGLKLVLFGTPEGVELQKIKQDLTVEQRAALLKENKITPLPTGLINLGNTCYLNSVMQFLKPSTELMKVIRSFSVDLGTSDGDEKLCATFRKFYETCDITDDSLPPLLIVEALRSKFPQFASKSRSGEGYAQQDADECLSALLTSFSRKSDEIDKLFGFRFETVLKCTENPDEGETRKVELVRLLSCHMGTQLNPVDHLHQGIKLSLDEKLTKRSETMNRDAEYTKKMRIASLPPYLVINFVRFEWKRASELSRTEAGRAKKVQFSLTFDVHEFCSDELKRQMQVGRYVWANKTEKDASISNGRKAKAKDTELNGTADSDEIMSTEPKQILTSGQYELTSIVTHQGRSADSGHYIAWTRKDDETWYKFDDDKVSEHRWKDIDLAGGRSDYHIAVLLMYRQKTFEATAEEISEAEAKILQEQKAISEAAGRQKRELENPSLSNEENISANQ